MKVSELIYRAYVKSNVISNEGETLTSAQNKEALFELNMLIQTLNSDGAEISLITSGDFTLSQGDSTLLLPDYVSVQKVEYFLGDVKLDLPVMALSDFYRNATLPSSQGIPTMVYPQRTASGILLNFYYTPDANYLVTVHGLKGIPSDLSIGDTLSGLDQFYQPLLYYQLASALRVNNDLPESLGIKKEISSIQSRLRRIKGYDTALNLITPFYGESPQTRALREIAEATILRGWIP